MQTSRNSIQNSNNNFEFLKNNFMQGTKSSLGRQQSKPKHQNRVNSRGSIHEETKRNQVLPSGQYKTNLSGINKCVIKPG